MVNYKIKRHFDGNRVETPIFCRRGFPNAQVEMSNNNKIYYNKIIKSTIILTIEICIIQLASFFVFI